MFRIRNRTLLLHKTLLVVEYSRSILLVRRQAHPVQAALLGVEYILVTLVRMPGQEGRKASRESQFCLQVFVIEALPD